RSRLLPLCFVVTEGGERLWSLKLESRRAALKRLVADNELDHTLDLASQARDATAQWVASVIRHKAPSLREQTADQLQKTLLAAEWCGEIVQGIEPVDEIERRLSLARLLEPLARLIGRREGAFRYSQPDNFYGRQTELSELRDYVGVLPSGGFISLRQVVRSLGRRRNQPIVITGLGGMGKSTLVAKF